MNDYMIFFRKIDCILSYNYNYKIQDGILKRNVKLLCMINDICMGYFSCNKNNFKDK